MQCVNIELKWLPCARCTWSIVIYSVCTTWVAACTDERPSGRSKWSLCTRILSFSMSILCAFQCAKCDSVLHKQWANVFHCSNVVSVFPRLPFFSSFIPLTQSLSHLFCIFFFYYVNFLDSNTHTPFFVISFAHCPLISSSSVVLFFSYFYCRFFVCEWIFAILSHRLTLDIEIFKRNNAFIWCVREYTWEFVRVHAHICYSCVWETATKKTNNTRTHIETQRVPLSEQCNAI